MKVQVVLRVDGELLKELDHFAVDWDTYRSEAIEQLIREAVEKHGTYIERAARAATPQGDGQ